MTEYGFYYNCAMMAHIPTYSFYAKNEITRFGGIGATTRYFCVITVSHFDKKKKVENYRFAQCCAYFIYVNQFFIWLFAYNYIFASKGKNRIFASNASIFSLSKISSQVLMYDHYTRL